MRLLGWNKTIMLFVKYSAPVDIFKSKGKDLGVRKNLNVTTLLITLLVICTAVLLGLVTLVRYVLVEEMTSMYLENLEEFTVPCDDLSLSSDEDVETFDVKKNGLNIFVTGDGKYMCSYTNATKLVNLVVERVSRLRLAKGLLDSPFLSCGNNSLASKPGHLTAAFTKISRHPNLSDDVVYWDKHPPNSNIDPSIHYHNGEITITEGRTYYIYVSVHFNLSRPIKENAKYFDKLHNFLVRICRRKYGYEQTILGRSKLFNISNGNAVSTLKIAGHLKLLKNDKIYIKVSDVSRLVQDSRGNTFGLFPT